MLLRSGPGPLGPQPHIHILHGAGPCSWIHVANPRLSCSLCLIDADGFSSAFVEEKRSVCCCVPEAADWCTQQSAHAARRFLYARLLLFRSQGKMAAISPTESRVVPYVAYFSAKISSVLGAFGRRGSEEHSSASANVAPRCHPYISRG